MVNYTTQDITKPINGYIVLTKRFWVCDEDTTKAIFHGDSPQCNREKRISEQLKDIASRNGLYKNLQIAFLEVAYIPNTLHQFQ